MNRFKKELRKKGIKLEEDYTFLPCEWEKGFVLEGISVNSEQAKFIMHFTSITIYYKMDCKGKIFSYSFD